ncbi:transmembrane protein 69 isoform X3 [Felis catus]|uniref:transmembrane protein 69 isoform X3 n=1 Tax=Felis catus TaxID=9685 RepID=UPI001D1A2586|nr:transmembrane protein 69 isoform X3 [Felis catus]
MAARPTRPRRGKRGRSDGQPGPPPSDHASHTPTRSHLPQERKRRNPVRVTLPAPHAANVPPLERQLFRAWSPTPPYGRWRQCPHPSADLNSLPFLAPLERERSAEFGIPPLLPRPNTRAWMRVNEWHTSDSAPPLSCKNELIRTAWHLPEQDFQLDPACFISSRSFLRHLQRYSFHGIRC